MKVKKTIKKVGAVAGSAIMVGMTMGAAQSLADFPGPFVGDDGSVASQVVVGSSGKQADVVGAIDIAAALGQQAIQTETKTATAAVSGGSFGWSASDGATLDTRNDNLFFGDALNNVRTTLTSQHVSSLADYTFTDDAGTKTTIEYFLYPGSDTVQFGQPQDRNNEDPVVYVNNDANVDASTHLFRVSANFGDTVTFNSSDVEGQDIMLFGNDYSVSEDTDGDTLVLFGSSQSVSLSTSGATTGTVTVAGNEHTIELHAVNTDGVVYSVDGGSLKQKKDGDSFTIEGETVRIDDVINLKDDAGSASFDIGSEELVLEDGAVIEDGDGNDIDGTYVDFTGTGVGTASNPLDIDTIDLYVGANDDDAEYVMAGESYSHPQFGDYVFHLGGLNPDGADGVSDAVGEVAVEPATPETAQVSFVDDGGDSATIEFFHRDTTGNSNELADDNNDPIHVVEGANVTEDDYFVSDAGDFAHVWQVTGIDQDDTAAASASDEATIDLQDAVTGNSITVDLDGDGTVYQGTEIIDGVTYYFEMAPSVTPGFFAAWGDGAGVDTGSAGADDLDLGNEVTVYPALDSENGAAVALAEETAEIVDGTATVALPSTESSAVVTHDLSTVTAPDTFEAGNVVYAALNATTNGGAVSIAVNESQNLGQSGNPVAADPSVLVVEPEDEADTENAYLVTPSWVGGNTEEVQMRSVDSYSGATRDTATLESDSDITHGYDLYGTFTVEDSDDQGSVSFYVPDGQAVAGAGFSAPGGALAAGGGAGSASVEYEALAGFGALPDMGMLDTEVTDSVRQSKHLVLVGGPAVNTLVADLAAENEAVWSQQDWIDNGEDSARVNLVADAFAEGQHALIVAGYGADDTRAAARYVSNYADYEQELADAGNTLTLTSADYPAN